MVLGGASDAEKIQTAGIPSIVTMEGALQVRYKQGQEVFSTCEGLLHGFFLPTATLSYTFFRLLYGQYGL